MPANQWYEPHKPAVAIALKKGKAAPKDGAVACTLVHMRDGAHLLCAAPVASKSSALVKEARNAGGKVISGGRLFFEDGKVIFEVSEGALPSKAKLVEGGAAVGVPLGGAVIMAAPGAAIVAEPDVAPEAPPAPPGAAPADEMEALKQALSRLVPAVQQAVKNHPERKNALLQPMAHCKQLIADGQAAAAKAALKGIIGLLQGQGPADVAPAAPAAPSPPSATAFTARAKALKGEIDRVQAADPARAADLSKLFVKAVGSARSQDLEAAQATLDAVEAGLAAAATKAVPPSVQAMPAAPAAPEAVSPPSAAAFLARAKALKGEIDRVQAADPARAADLSKLLVKAAGSAKAHDLETAQATLDAVEAGLAGAATAPGTAEPPPSGEQEAAQEEPDGGAPPSARAPEAAESEGPPATEPQTAAARWDAARAAVVAQLKEEIKWVVATKDPDAGPAELELKAVLQQLSGEMESQQKAAEMESYLQEDDVVAEVCELAFDLKTPLLKVLREIKLLLPV